MNKNKTMKTVSLFIGVLLCMTLMQTTLTEWDLTNWNAVTGNENTINEHVKTWNKTTTEKKITTYYFPFTDAMNNSVLPSNLMNYSVPPLDNIRT